MAYEGSNPSLRTEIKIPAKGTPMPVFFVDFLHKNYSLQRVYQGGSVDGDLTILKLPSEFALCGKKLTITGTKKMWRMRITAVECVSAAQCKFTLTDCEMRRHHEQTWNRCSDFPQLMAKTDIKVRFNSFSGTLTFRCTLQGAHVITVYLKKQ